MRSTLLITLFFISTHCLGQDTLQTDTTIGSSASAIQPSIQSDSSLFTSESPTVEKKAPRKKAKRVKRREEKLVAVEQPNTGEVETKSEDNGHVFVWIFIIVLVLIFLFLNLRPDVFRKHPTVNTIPDDPIADYLKRITLSRRDYYRQVYLQSDAWQRKRYLVLKRDNWRCVYCGGRATQVHHTRYAKRNIGKEPIEWLVSVCKTCHDAQH